MYSPTISKFTLFCEQNFILACISRHFVEIVNPVRIITHDRAIFYISYENYYIGLQAILFFMKKWAKIAHFFRKKCRKVFYIQVLGNFYRSCKQILPITCITRFYSHFLLAGTGFDLECVWFCFTNINNGGSTFSRRSRGKK